MVRFSDIGWHIVVAEVIGYLIRVGDATSQLINVALLFGSNPNESISGRAYRLRNKSHGWAFARMLIDALLYPFEANHCQKSHDADVDRAARLLREQGD